jgi:hypothetical protein
VHEDEDDHQGGGHRRKTRLRREEEDRFLQRELRIQRERTLLTDYRFSRATSLRAIFAMPSTHSLEAGVLVDS